MKKSYVIAKEFDFQLNYGKPKHYTPGEPADPKDFGPVHFKRLLAEGTIGEAPAEPEVLPAVPEPARPVRPVRPPPEEKPEL